MKPLHYIIFHPDHAREKLMIKGRAIVNGIPENWMGAVWVDANGGNEDPFVLCDKWLYSYCHATQLRRVPSMKSPYVMKGSYLFFCSGDAANRGELQVDTVFVIDHVAEWPRSAKGLPLEFHDHCQNTHSDLWNYHFRFSFSKPPEHEGIYTYVAKAWSRDADDYSFLPIDVSGNRVSLSLDDFTPDLARIIRHKIYGKRPIMLDEHHKNEILNSILSSASIKVIHVHTRRHQSASDIASACSHTHKNIALKPNSCN